MLNKIDQIDIVLFPLIGHPPLQPTRLDKLDTLFPRLGSRAEGGKLFLDRRLSLPKLFTSSGLRLGKSADSWAARVCRLIGRETRDQREDKCQTMRTPMTTGSQRINYGRRRRRKITVVFAVCKNHNIAATATVVIIVVVITSMHKRTKNDISGCVEEEIEEL